MKVKNWSRFQHYKNRKPPWIKLYRDLLDDQSYMSLPLASMALAPCIWLLASETDGEITDDIGALAWRLRQTVEVTLGAVEGLLSTGFLIGRYQDASSLLAGCLQRAIAETERETEKETEKLPCPPAVDDEGFKRFWDIYPKKKKKQDAFKAWRSTKKIRPSLEIVLESVRRHAKTFDWEKDGGQYIPLPASYLRGGCWDDDLDIVTRSKDPVCSKCLVRPPSVDPPSQFCSGCLEGILAESKRMGVEVE